MGWWVVPGVEVLATGTVTAGPKGSGARRWPVVVAGAIWLLGEVVAGAPGVKWVAVLAGACEVAAWALTVAVVSAAVIGLSGRPSAAWLAAGTVVLLEGWLHRLPGWYAPDLLGRYLGLPPAGTLGQAYRTWDAGAVIWWRTCHVVTDVLLVLVLAAVLREPLVSRLSPARVRSSPGPVPGPVAVAVVVAGVLVALVAGLTGLLGGGAATPAAAGTFLVANAVPVLAAGLLGALALAQRGGTAPVRALLAGVGLDVLAGLLGDRDPWLGPPRFPRYCPVSSGRSRQC